MLIYDTEIQCAIANPGEERQPDIRYCNGWDDFAGMGVAVVGVYDLTDARPRVFMADNLDELADLIAHRSTVIGFNNHRIDDNLLAANGVALDPAKSLDLAEPIWRAAGVPPGVHPKGLGLDALCAANGLPGKSGSGAMAPLLYQTGKLGQLVDYCLTDVIATLRLYRHLKTKGGFTDPRNGSWLTVGALR